MPPKASEDELCHALLEFVTDGTYPESENLVASEFPTSIIPEELQRIAKAREQTEVRRDTSTKQFISLILFFHKERDMFAQPKERFGCRRMDLASKAAPCGH